MVAVHLLNDAGLLRPDDATAVLALAETTCAELTDELRLGPADVMVGDFPGWAIEELGVGGFAPGPHTALIAVEPGNPAFASWRESLPTTLAHELHHVARWQGPGYGRTLLDSLVSEGSATYFEESRCGRTPVYAQPVGDPERLWAAARPLLDAQDQHARWFFGTGDLPRWAGYYLGYELARRFCTASRLSAVDAARVEAADFLTAAW